MEQEPQNESLDQTPSKNSVFAFFDVIRLKHIILFFLCLLFLGVLIGGGNNERPPKRLSIKGKKCNTDKNFDKTKKDINGSIENLATKSKDNINKIGSNIKGKADEAIEKTGVALKKGQDKVEKTIENTSNALNKAQNKARETSECISSNSKPKKEKALNSKEGNVSTKSSIRTQKNSLTKGLKNTKEDASIEGTEEIAASNILDKESIKNEVDLLRNEVNELKSRIEKLNQSSNQQNGASSIPGDMNFIDKRIEFWQSVKENAQNK